jgi:transcriptional regulator with XRE-family HTH domain
MENLFYTGKSLSRKQLAEFYGVSNTQFNRWLKGLQHVLPDLGSRSVLRPAEINKLIELWGDFRAQEDKNSPVN